MSLQIKQTIARKSIGNGLTDFVEGTLNRFELPPPLAWETAATIVEERKRIDAEFGRAVDTDYRVRLSEKGSSLIIEATRLSNEWQQQEAAS